jgi:hypothetical protein
MELVSEADGMAYRIDPDFRAVLACLRRLTDPDRTELDKRVYLGRRFFLNHPPEDLDRVFHAFVTGDVKADAAEPALMDFELDAGAIYASFLQQYRIDLLRENMHWIIFRELLAGLGEQTALGVRIRLRALDESAVAPEDRARVRRIKEQLALPATMGKAERALLDELNRKLAAGENPGDIIAKLQEV